ncbi:MAG: DUF3014 domain-containing protein [Vicinamibacterales bacterium]
MSSLDDLPLDTGQEGEAVAGPSEPPPSYGPRVAAAGVAILLVAAVAAWFYLGRTAAPPASTVAGPAAAPPAAAVDTPAAPAAAPLPPLGEMDPVVRGLFATLGSEPELVKWLATDDLVGSIATAIDKLSQGQSPSRDLAALLPSGHFATVRRRDVTNVDPRSFARYDALARAAASIDSAKLATIYATLKPRIAEAYAAQGHPDGGLDQALARAVGVIVSTPDVPADAALVPGVGGFDYANPAYERLPPAQKHLLRMGPDNVRAVRDAVRRFAEAAGVVPATD